MEINGDNTAMIKLFNEYMAIFGTPGIGPEIGGDPELRGKTLGLINGSAWISLWSCYFGRKYLPGVKLINVCNDAIQLNFIKAHQEGRECPPEINKEMFVQYAVQTHRLYNVDAILITCSTMNRSYPLVQKAMAQFNVPVIQIDQPMMEQALAYGSRVLIISTHGPTIENTRSLLEETAAQLGKPVSFVEKDVPEAFGLLDQGDIAGHNEAIARAIRDAARDHEIDAAVLAQLSMSAFQFSYPDCINDFGFPVLTSAECGMQKVRSVLLGR